MARETDGGAWVVVVAWRRGSKGQGPTCRTGQVRDAANALDATGTLQLVGFPDVLISGSARIRVNSFSTPLEETLTIPGTDQDVFVSFGANEHAPVGARAPPFVDFEGLETTEALVFDLP